MWDLKKLSRSRRESAVTVSDFNLEIPFTLELTNAVAPIPKVRKSKVHEVYELTDDEKCCLRTLHGHEYAVKALDTSGGLIFSGDIRGNEC